jgi:UDPglucose--hexose-1-phosphate uridylyltransferase
MKGAIQFERHTQSSTFHNPMKGGELDTQQLELRRDPLTGHQSVWNPRLEDKVAMFLGPTDVALIERLARDSEARCFICGDRWQETTPRYPEQLLPGGRIERGEAVLFPNLFPVAQVHAVARVGARHHVPLGELSADAIRDAFGACVELMRRLAVEEPSARFLTVNGNFLGPAGASIVHPHFQLVGGDVAPTALELLLARSRAWHERHGGCYWRELASRERADGSRFVAELGAAQWLTSFAPQGANEVLALLPSKRELGEPELADLAEGLARVLRGYAAMGLSTFNFSILAGALGEGDESFCCQLRVISRQNVHENYRADDYFLQKMLRNELVLNTPEALASTLRPAFRPGSHR